MDPEGVIHDPVFGTLRLYEEGRNFAFYEGEIDLTPKHWVEITLEYAPEASAISAALAAAQETYQRVREGEWDYRHAAARELQFDINRFLGPDESWTVDEVARALTLCRIDLSGEEGAGWVLHYDSDGKFGDDPIIVYFDPDGLVEAAELG